MEPDSSPPDRETARLDTQGTSAEIKKEIELEIAHVLFVDIGYSKLLINEQKRRNVY